MTAVKQGLLREELYYRLNVVPVQLPALRERGEGIMLLAEHFLKDAAHEEGRKFKSFSDDVKKMFMNYDWPGNVRELENTIRRIVVLNNGNSVEMGMLNVLGQEGRDALGTRNAEGEIAPSDFLPQSRDEIKPLRFYEREVI